MHIKRIHEMEEKLTEIALCEINKGIECVNTAEMGAVIDMIKDLACAEKEAREAKEMEKEEEDEKKENEYFLKMLKEEYGEDEGERRFYDNYRYKRSGRFAPKGSGSYMPRSSGRRSRRGYEEPMYFLPPEVYMNYSPEELRDMDRAEGRMYYGGGSSGGSYSGNSGSASGQSGSSMNGGNMGGNAGGSTRGYEEYQRGYSEGEAEGNRRGYQEGYSEGQRSGRSQGSNSRYERAKRGYEEAKEKHKGNTPEDKQLTMREAEKVLNVVFDELDEMLEDAPPEMKNMVKTKGMTRFQKIS